MPKIVITIEFFSLLIFLIGRAWDSYNTSNYHSTDGGQTTTYNYNQKARTIRRNLTWFSSILSVVGILIWIWI